MQDIPRNELLDKLADGWTLRRKIWANECNIRKNGGATAVPLRDLLKDDWEGELPEPRRMYEGCAITFAFEKLRDGAAFIRRTEWDEMESIKRPPCVHISADDMYISQDDILATDWEVWG